MTREEAIKRLKEIDIRDALQEDYDALYMAIKALEQEPCEDAISRQYLIEKATNWEKHFHDSERYVSLTDIQNAPPVKPQEPFDIETYCKEHFVVMVDKDVWEKAEKALKQEPKTGRWEYVQYDYNPGLGNWHCSECRCVVIECVDKEEKGGIPLYKYCPQCGAKMQEAEIEG